MKKITGMVVFAMALTLSGCAMMHSHHGGCCHGKCSMEKHDADQKDGCCKGENDGKCDMPDKAAETKK